MCLWDTQEPPIRTRNYWDSSARVSGGIWVQQEKLRRTSSRASLSDRLDILRGTRRMHDRLSFSQLGPIERRARARMVGRAAMLDVINCDD